MEAQVLLGGLGMDGGEHGQDPAWLIHGVRFCGNSDPLHPPQSPSPGWQRQDVGCVCWAWWWWGATLRVQAASVMWTPELTLAPQSLRTMPPTSAEKKSSPELKSGYSF